MEFVARVLVQIPDPRRHLVRYYGFYSNAARGKRRKAEARPSLLGTDRLSGDGDRPHQRALLRRRERAVRIVEMQPIYSRFLDSWLEAPAPTAENPSGFTSPARLSSNPTSRIDYVFVSPDVEVSLAYVPIDAKTRFASDHYPVASDVALPGSAVGIRRKAPTLPEAVEGEDAAEVEPDDEAGVPPPM
jgi:hypothetical protein